MTAKEMKLISEQLLNESDICIYKLVKTVRISRRDRIRNTTPRKRMKVKE